MSLVIWFFNSTFVWELFIFLLLALLMAMRCHVSRYMIAQFYLCLGVIYLSAACFAHGYEVSCLSLCDCSILPLFGSYLSFCCLLCSLLGGVMSLVI